MRNILKSTFLIALSFLTFSCSNQQPPRCCNNISASLKIEEPLFSGGEIDPKELEHLEKEKKTFDPQRVQIVDRIGDNYLVRGSVPVIDGKFAYKEITETIDRKMYAKNGDHLDANYLLVDISLLQLGEFSVERKWYSDNPNEGCYWNRPIIGSLIDPAAVDYNLYIEAESMNLLNNFIEQIHTLVKTKCDQQVIVYVHCMGGHNRTGEIIACYRMKYLGMSYEEATRENDELLGPIHKINQNAVIWYALYLREVKKITTIGKINGK